MLGNIATPAVTRIAVICFRAVPREDILAWIDGSLKGTPISPVLSERIDNVRVVMTPITKLKKVFLCKAIWNIIFGKCACWDV
jgi:hypothetical protein